MLLQARASTCRALVNTRTTRPRLIEKFFIFPSIGSPCRPRGTLSNFVVVQRYSAFSCWGWFFFWWFSLHEWSSQLVLRWFQNQWCSIFYPTESSKCASSHLNVYSFQSVNTKRLQKDINLNIAHVNDSFWTFLPAAHFWIFFNIFGMNYYFFDSVCLKYWKSIDAPCSNLML